MRTKLNLPDDIPNKTELVTATGRKCLAMRKRKNRNGQQEYRLHYLACTIGKWKYPKVLGKELYIIEELRRDGVKLERR